MIKLTKYLFLACLSDLVLIVFCLNTNYGEGGSCTLGGSRNYKGVCKNIKDCSPAISSLRAGIPPSLCVKIDKTALVCCTTERQFSFQRCRNYEEIATNNDLKSNSDSKTSPLLPIAQSELPDDLSKDDSKEAVTSFPVLFVVGGSSARPDQFPYMAALGYQSGGGQKVSWLCGGTLISEQHVLTAAHCLKSNNRERRLTKVLLGDVNLSEDTLSQSSSRVIVQVESFVLHPNYTSSLKYNDIGIIKLAKKVKLSGSVKPACLPQPMDRLELEPSLTAHGWGLTEYAGSPSESLQFAELTRVSSQKCNAEYEDQAGSASSKGIIFSQFCAGDELKDTCEGDSGSGLVVKRPIGNFTASFVVGITSFGSKYCGYGKPGVYTNVLSYLTWVEDIVWQ